MQRSRRCPVSRSRWEPQTAFPWFSPVMESWVSPTPVGAAQPRVVVRALRAAMTTAGHPPTSGAIGPGIGSCCFEVGPDVLERFPRSEAITSWGTPGVNLRSAILDDMTGLEVWVDGRCTMSDEGFHSYRKTKTTERQVTVVWIPD